MVTKRRRVKRGSIAIDTVPLPERPAIGTWPTPEQPVSVEIPVRLLREFEKDARIVIRHPWIVGIPLPEVLLKRILENPKAYRELMGKFDIMFVPK